MKGKGPSAGYKFNTFQEIKSHSSVLFNERLAILFYMLDMRSINLNAFYQPSDLMQVRALIKQIYKNIRTLIRNNPIMRATLHLDTKDPGIYITDIAMSTVDKMIEFCEMNRYTTKRIYILVEELNKVEMILKDILQYYHYFIRPEFKQKPDVEIATEAYKEVADKRTVEELQAIVGNNHKIDFSSLTTDRVEVGEDAEKEALMLKEQDDDEDEDDEDYDDEVDADVINE